MSEIFKNALEKMLKNNEVTITAYWFLLSAYKADIEKLKPCVWREFKPC
jgi:hypothetical protein